MIIIIRQVSQSCGMIQALLIVRYREPNVTTVKEYHMTTTDTGVVFNLRNEIIENAAGKLRAWERERNALSALK